MSRPQKPGKLLASQTSPHNFQSAVVAFWTQRCRELLQERFSLPEEDLSYLVTAVDKLKDQRLKECVAELIGWGTDDRAELETFCAIALEVMKDSSPSRLRNAALKVELRYHLRDVQNETPPTTGPNASGT